MRIINNSTFFKNYLNPTSFCANTNFPSKDIKVSVIIPIYNQEKYISTALDSLINQSLEETEFICVNDGSDPSIDHSLEILNNYANKDSRVKIINQENQGTGKTRNNGIKAAQGKYIAFLDPDDWFDKDALESAFTKSEKQNCDMLVFNHRLIDEKTGVATPAEDIAKRIKNFYPAFNKDANFNWKNIKPVSFRAFFWMSWNKFFKRDFVRNANLKFSECSLAEDNAFVLGATLKAKSISILDKYIYNYLQHEGSAIRKISDKNLCIFKVIEDVKNIVNSLGLNKTLKEEFDAYVIKLISLHAKQILSQGKLIELCINKLTPDQNQIIKQLRLIKGFK